MDTQSREISSAWEAMVIAGGVVSAGGGVTRDVLTQKACRSHSSSIGSSQKELAGLLGTARCSEVFGHSRDKHANYVEANLCPLVLGIRGLGGVLPQGAYCSVGKTLGLTVTPTHIQPKVPLTAYSFSGRSTVVLILAG